MLYQLLKIAGFSITCMAKWNHLNLIFIFKEILINIFCLIRFNKVLKDLKWECT